MAYCSNCGAQIPEHAAACPKCASPAVAMANSSGALANPSSEGKGESKMADSGLAENIAGALCYAFGWVSGLVFLLIDKRPFVRFHAAQSIVVFGGLQLLYIVLGQIFFRGFYYGAYGFFSLASLLFGALELVALILWIVLMVKAYQGEKYRIGPISGLTDALVGK
jgi:uncharacterized membrane protein